MQDYFAIEITPKTFEFLCAVYPPLRELKDSPGIFDYHFIVFDYPEEGEASIYDIEAFNGDFDHIQNDVRIQVRKFIAK